MGPAVCRTQAAAHCGSRRVEAVDSARRLLTTLNANLNELDDEDAKALAPAIASSGSLAELNSSHNQIRAEGIIALAPAINISWNRIFSQGAAQELLAAMKGNDMKRIMRDAWVARRSGGSGVCEESEVEQTAV